MCPSPYGEVGFNRAKTLREAKIEAASFRPLTGKLVLIPVRHGKESREIRLKFPSPYGEVGFNLCQWCSGSSVCRAKFPSPYGEVGFDQPVFD